MRCWLLQGKTTIGSWERFSLAKLTKSDAIGKYHLTRDAEFDVCALQLCVIIYDISLERLVPSFQYTTASSWQYTTSVSTMRSSSRGAERKRKRKRGDLKWRQGISIGQHSYYVASGTFAGVPLHIRGGGGRRHLSVATKINRLMVDVAKMATLATKTSSG